MDKLKGLFYRKDDCAKEYKIGDVLGTGSFAVVKRGVCRRTGTEWAIKCIEKAKLDKEDEAALRTEVDILERVDHPNIVKLRQVFDCPKVFYMVMELMTGGELFDRVVEKSKFSEEEAARVIVKITDALKYCHERGVVHRDLKPENLLFCDRTDESEVKIADFGLAKLLKDEDMMATACGTPGYVAPEILEGRPYTDKVDIWSLGVITYILLCGFPPFYDENNAALFAQIKAGAFDFPAPYWDDVTDSAKDLVRHMLLVDPARRYTAADVLRHPWCTGGAVGGAALNVGEQLRKFNARRRFRQGVRKVQALAMFAKLGKLHISDSAAGGSPLIAAAAAASASSSGAAGAASVSIRGT